MPWGPVLEVDVPEDHRLDDFRDLKDLSYRSRVESPGGFDSGRFVVEGWLAVERLLTSRYRPRAVLVVTDRLERLLALEPAPSCPVLVAARPVVERVVGFDLHRGVVASADRGLPIPWTDVVARASRLVVCDGVTDAQNVGGIARNALALGADALAVDPSSADPLSRRAVRVSTGHVLWLRWCRIPLAVGLGALVDDGWQVVALDPSGSVLLDDVAPAEKCAVVVGSEGPGLSEASRNAATSTARIAMHGGADSINVASAVAVACHRLFGRPQR